MENESRGKKTENESVGLRLGSLKYVCPTNPDGD